MQIVTIVLTLQLMRALAVASVAQHCFPAAPEVQFEFHYGTPQLPHLLIMRRQLFQENNLYLLTGISPNIIRLV